jgi:ferric-dicitrate binding protein FerR (iron transport regulator)
MENKIPVNKIIRNIASDGSEYTDEIREWLNDSIENENIYQDLLNIWQVTGSFPQRFSPNRTRVWQGVQNHIHSQKRKYYLSRRIAQIAAAVIIVFLSVWSGTQLDNLNRKSQFTEVFSPAGQKTRIILPDSSIILLNGNSQIRYNKNFNENNRIVELKGEGFFDVHKDLSRQFTVRTPELDVKVFGTSFNVKANENDETIEVGLKTGKIGIERNEKEIAQLVPGQMATFDKKELKLDLGRINMNMVSAWTQEEMVFEEDSLKEIVKYMERWYGVDIQVEPALLDGELLTFKVKTESLSELLNLINLLKPIKYQIDGKQVIITNP